MKKTKAKKPSKKAVKKSAKKTVAKKSKPRAVIEKPKQVTAPVQEQASKRMTTEEYVKANQPDLHYTADVQWRDDKEGDFAHKGIAAIIAIDWATDSDETELTDYSDVRAEMESDESHPITKMIWRKPKAQ